MSGGPFKYLAVESNRRARGFAIVVLWLLQVSLILNQSGGIHITLQVSLGPFSVSGGFGLWDSYLPK